MTDMNLQSSDKEMGQLYADSDSAQADFVKAMKEYQKEAESKYRVDVNPNARHDWSEVENMAQVIQEKYSEKESKGTRGKVRHFARKFCDHAKSFKTLIAFLPSESIYGSVVCGGLKLILGVGRNFFNNY